MVILCKVRKYLKVIHHCKVTLKRFSSICHSPLNEGKLKKEKDEKFGDRKERKKDEKLWNMKET